MAVAAAVAQFGSGIMTLGVSRFSCHFPQSLPLSCVTKLSTAMTSSRHDGSTLKTQCIVPLSFHSLSNTALLYTQKRPVITCALFICLYMC